MEVCVPLYEASMVGDWKEALCIVTREEKKYPHLLKCSITDKCETMLHIAVSTQRIDFVRNLVNEMEKEDLTYQNKNGNTALCFAAITGNVEIATIMVNKNQDLVIIPNKADMIPVYIAALYGKRDMVEYLYGKTNHYKQSETNHYKQAWVYLKCVEAELFVTAQRIFVDHKELVNEQTQLVLGVLARKPLAFSAAKQHRIFDSVISCIKGRHDAKISEAMQLLKNILTSLMLEPMDTIDGILEGHNTERVLFVAVEMGNTKFIVELIRQYPDLIWKKNDKDQSIFHVAVSHRQQSIFNLLNEIGSMKELIVVFKDKDGNDMLHLAGKKAPESRLQEVSGAAFQLQRELLWYKEVESMMPFSYRDRKNNCGKTPHELFTETHEDMIIKGEKWMKGTAGTCMVVATLVATIVFAVAFTIPGGYNQNSGFPNFLHNGPFIVFVILDAISLILSSTSILVFLSILTSRYTPEDFIESLPRKLIIGLSMLFSSIVTMMTAFSISFFVLYRHKFVIVACFISLLALVPIVSSAQLHYPLLKDVLHSTYGSRYIFKPDQRLIYHQNPRS